VHNRGWRRSVCLSLGGCMGRKYVLGVYAKLHNFGIDKHCLLIRLLPLGEDNIGFERCATSSVLFLLTPAANAPNAPYTGGETPLGGRNTESPAGRHKSLSEGIPDDPLLIGKPSLVLFAGGTPHTLCTPAGTRACGGNGRSESAFH